MTNSAADTEKKAAEWLVSRDSEGWSASDEQAFEAWKNEATANRIAVLRLESVWTKADRMRASSLASDDVSSVPQAAPGERGATAPARAKWVWPALAASIAALIFLAVPGTAPRDDYATGVGQFQRLPLADGSRVELNTDTRLSVAYSSGERLIDLAKGEAFFAVEKDRARPFVVRVGSHEVVAVGTAFSVRRRGSDLEVVVSEGRVRLGGVKDGAAGPIFVYVSAGERALAGNRPTLVERLDPADADAALGWREGLLVLHNRSLPEVAAEFNRYNVRQFVVDPSAAGVRVDGTFRASNVDGFLRLLEQGFGVKGVATSTDRILLTKS